MSLLRDLEVATAQLHGAHELAAGVEDLIALEHEASGPLHSLVAVLEDLSSSQTQMVARLVQVLGRGCKSLFDDLEAEVASR